MKSGSKKQKVLLSVLIFLLVIISFIYLLYTPKINFSRGLPKGSSCVLDEDCAKGLSCQEASGIPKPGMMFIETICFPIDAPPRP